MSRAHPSLLRIAAVTVVLAACADGAPTITEPPQLGKGGTQGAVDTDSRATWAWANTVLIDGVEVPAGIRGDGRAADGSDAGGGPSVYQGDVCDVNGKIFYWDPDYSQFGDAVLGTDLTINQAECSGVPRLLRLDVDQAGGDAEHATTVFTNARRVMQIPVGGSEVRDMNVNIEGVAGCERLLFHRFADGTGVEIASQVRITRLDANTDDRAPRQWLVETQGTHSAMCSEWRKGRIQPTGVTKRLPFSVVVTEVPYSP